MDMEFFKLLIHVTKGVICSRAIIIVYTAISNCNSPSSLWFSFSMRSRRICWRMAFFHSARYSVAVLLGLSPDRWSPVEGSRCPNASRLARGERGNSSRASECSKTLTESIYTVRAMLITPFCINRKSED